jgi:hypothetical protein
MRLSVFTLLFALVAVFQTATTAQAGNQLFEGSWTVKAQGNECSDLVDPTPGPHCGGGLSESYFYSAFGIPQGIQCNPEQPRCPFESTPTDGAGVFAPLGGQQTYALYCAPWFDWQGYGTSVRPAKGGTARVTGTGMAGIKFPPLYRNPAFFTSGGQPNTTFCTATSTGATPGGKGLVQAGQPIEGKWGAVTTGTPGIGGFTFAAAPAGAAGVRTTGQAGDFPAIYPYMYSYTYATLRNDVGIFGPGQGPGSFNLIKTKGSPVWSINVKQGSAKFGGTMKMLGALTTKVCRYRNGGCRLGTNDWHYEAIGTPAPTQNGVVTNGKVVTSKAYLYHTALHQTLTRTLKGSRFPWTTGIVTVTASHVRTASRSYRWPHKTVHYAHGYDNRDSVTGKGTIQLVSPVLTRWLQPCCNNETGGIGILRIKFVPEPQTWAILVAGVSLLGVGARMRKR